ncbi:MAG: response regulator transcription factor [Alicyclobacillus sp.]|nr:response regulator transcription factor [Alicyclobacillus sp.]
MRILVVEDEQVLAEALRTLFIRHAYTADAVSSACDAFDAAMTGGYDCLVVDVRLPDGSGIDLVADLREAGLRTPILVLTVQNELAHRVQGLNAGADDYLGKPFEAEELLARVHALIRRASAGVHTDKLTYGSAILHSKSRTLEVRSKLISLSSKEFLLLEYLFRHPGQVLTRDQLVAHVWGPDAVVSDHALDTYVYFLRKKAATLGWRNIIETVRGCGYTLGTPL